MNDRPNSVRLRARLTDPGHQPTVKVKVASRSVGAPWAEKRRGHRVGDAVIG